MTEFGIANIIAREAPTIAQYSFDAVLEQSFSLEVEVPSYPVESGAKISDHRIVQPARYTLKGVISNTPLKVGVFDFAGGLVSNLSDNPVIGAAAGMSAGFLGAIANQGGDGTRASAAVENLINILEGAEPFTVTAADVTLQNMVCTKFSRTMTPENENGLVFELELQEYISLDRLSQEGQVSHKQQKPAAKECGVWGKLKEKGTAAMKEVTGSVKSAVESVTSIASEGLDKLSELKTSLEPES